MATTTQAAAASAASAASALSRPGQLAPAFLGDVIEICIVTRSAEKTMDGLLALGIGPFSVHTFTPASVSEQTFRGQPSEFELKVCFAQQGRMTWEIMQPVSGPSVMAEFLERHGEGVHHVAFDCGHVKFADRRAEFERRGFELAQSGTWHGKTGTCRFMFFETEASVTTCFETYEFSDDWQEPEDTVIYGESEEQRSINMNRMK